MTAVLDQATSAGDPKVGDQGSKATRGVSFCLFAGLFTFYTVLGFILILRYNITEGDGISRVANAGYALWSKDPHLSAMGFVWGPLPSLLELPVLQLSGWWPELRTRGLAGVVQSAAFTAGCAVLIRLIAIDRAVSVGWGWVAVACISLNPMIVIYAGTGMSESAMLFCILWAVRYLLRWLDSPRVFDLASVGLALAVGYLVRYESLIAAAGAAVVVAGVAFLRAPRAERIASTALSVMVVLFPIGVTFILFAAAGWIMTGEAFAIISSDYGNSNQIQVALQRGFTNASTDAPLLAHRLFSIQPLLGIAVILATARAVSTRRIDPLVPIGAFGTVLMFAGWGQLSGSTFGWFRYFMAAIPMVIVIALVFWTPPTRPAAPADTRWRRCGAALLGASLLVGIPVTAKALLDPEINLGATSVIGVRIPRRSSPLSTGQAGRPAGRHRRSAGGRLPRRQSAPAGFGVAGHLPDLVAVVVVGESQAVRDHQRLRLPFRAQPAVGVRGPLHRADQSRDQRRGGCDHPALPDAVGRRRRTWVPGVLGSRPRRPGALSGVSVSRATRPGRRITSKTRGGYPRRRSRGSRSRSKSSRNRRWS